MADANDYKEALTPSGATKAAYIGDFCIKFPMFDMDGQEYIQPINVPWTTIKEIMAAIKCRAESTPPQEESITGKRPKLPIKDARDIAKIHGWDQVIIVARKVGDNGFEHVVTYGKTAAHCEAAARAGNAIKHHLMKWPCSLFDSTLRVFGVCRDADNPKALSLALSVDPSDDDIRMVHDFLRAPTHSPTAVEQGA